MSSSRIIRALNQRKQIMQTLTILGSTGSIGVSTLDVVSRHPDKFQIFALAGHNQVEKLAGQCRHFAPKYAVVADENRANELRQQLGSLHTKVLFSKQALIDIATAPEVTGVMCAIVRTAGLPCFTPPRNTAKLFIWRTKKR